VQEMEVGSCGAALQGEAPNHVRHERKKEFGELIHKP
jgi:hypothetical protein